MHQLFTVLSRAVEGSAGIALMASFFWGVLSILLSPCHLASIPLIIGFIGDQREITTRRAFVLSLLFSVGILVTIVVIGVLTAWAGRIAGDLGPGGNYVVALVFFAVGLHLLDVIQLPFGGPGQVGWERKGKMAAFVLGLLFGVALGPCTFAYMAPVLAITFKVSASNWLYGALLLCMYGVGHCAVIVASGTSYEWIEHYLRWGRRSNIATHVKHVCGGLVLLAGLWLVYTAR